MKLVGTRIDCVSDVCKIVLQYSEWFRTLWSQEKNRLASCVFCLLPFSIIVTKIVGEQAGQTASDPITWDYLHTIQYLYCSLYTEKERTPSLKLGKKERRSVERMGFCLLVPS